MQFRAGIIERDSPAEFRNSAVEVAIRIKGPAQVSTRRRRRRILADGGSQFPNCLTGMASHQDRTAEVVPCLPIAGFEPKRFAKMVRPGSGVIQSYKYDTQVVMRLRGVGPKREAAF